jgi:hypothetical protein
MDVREIQTPHLHKKTYNSSVGPALAWIMWPSQAPTSAPSIGKPITDYVTGGNWCRLPDINPIVWSAGLMGYGT